MKTIPKILQIESKDCGATCLKIIAKYYNRDFPIQYLRSLSETTREGANLLTLSEAAEKIGFRTLGVKINYESLKSVSSPCILYWNKVHFVVFHKIKKKRFNKKQELIIVSDPAIGIIEYKVDEFIKYWIGNNANEATQEGVALFLEPSPEFYNDTLFENNEKKLDFSKLIKYIIPYKIYFFQIFLGLIVVTFLQLISPFITQNVVDIGIQNGDLKFINILLLSQIFLFVGRTSVEAIRSWLILHLSGRINISIVSDFFIKLMKLPISYFDVKLVGDIIQRINDHERIEKILTNSSLTIIFSMINVIIMGGVLAYYNIQIFIIFFVGSIFYFLWITIFLKRRAILDYKRFSALGVEQSKVMELINGMQEIKLHNAERFMRWKWEHIQVAIFKLSLKGLTLEQVQDIGSSFINELKNVLILFVSAKLVLNGSLSIGTMLAISTIVGGLNSPILQLVGFIREVQDARISIKRLSEIHEMDNEKENDNLLNQINFDNDIVINNLTFRYPGNQYNTLEDINLIIKRNKVTAIVGTSGSGKSTLLKLLLNIYKPLEGEILIDNLNLNEIAPKKWREQIGTVMQEGYIFNDTIANNIAFGNDEINQDRLLYAAKTANCSSFINTLPLRFNTIIGAEGVGLSTGQKQRILIARAIYKNPKILFFDEATSALDANNESDIMKKLNFFFNQKTVVIIAHRLSTVINADQIVVLENGKIIEIGNHDELIKKKGNYFELIKNQLQIAN